MIRKIWQMLAGIGILGLLTSVIVLGQSGDTVEVNWNSAVLTILITAIMVAGIILYEWVRLKKPQ